MTPTTVICITVVAESVLERRIVDDILGCGARGWTASLARGSGPNDRRVGDIEGGNVRIETLVPQDVAERIWQVLARKYFPHYAVVAWSWRGDGGAGGALPALTAARPTISGAGPPGRS